MSEELPKRYFIWGEYDTGKTLFVNKLAQRMKTLVYNKRCASAWESYKGEKVVHIEDLTPEKVQYIRNSIKEWIDYHPFRSGTILNSKTGEIIKEGKMIDPSTYIFIITSRKSPEEILSGLDDYTRGKIYNRIEILHFKKDSVKKVKEMNTINKDLSIDEIFKEETV